ncbi:MAG TPA: carbohydrate binding domain-containing protein [Pyrinomonadaceae bacterium]|nr:carbohydrate binding domain-containing protein [Pyrinomonadaceae bacterium]
MIKSISLDSLLLRLLPIILAILILLAGYFSFNWTFGNMIAQHADTKELAELAIQMAPNDPQSYFSLAYLNEKSFSPEDLPVALASYEKAVSVSPSDYRLWLSLGKIREQSGDSKGAVAASRKALELAPNYSQVHWVLGNQLLRQGNDEEAYQEIRKAVEGNPTYANPAVNMTWQIFNGDVGIISQKIGDSIPIKAALAPFLAKQKRFDEALSFWNSVPDEEKSTKYKTNGQELLAIFMEAKSFRQVLALQTQINGGTAEKFNIGAIYNGDFEKNVPPTGAGTFDWQISEGAQPQISLDGSQKHSGERSLIILFNSNTGQENRTVQQTIVVESGKSYKFEAFYRSDLKALSGLKWEIVDAADGKVLTSTNETVQTMANWTALNADFTTNSTTQAVILRLVKVPCKQNLCPISGKVWFDDLSLK